MPEELWGAQEAWRGETPTPLVFGIHGNTVLPCQDLCHWCLDGFQKGRRQHQNGSKRPGFIMACNYKLTY